MKLGGSDLIGQEQNEKMKKRIPLFSAQGGAVTVPPEDDEYTKMRRLLGLGEPTPVELGQPEPEGDRLARERLGTTIDLTPVTKEGRTLYEDIGRAKTEQAEYDRYLADKELREAAGITPRTGMPEYEATAARMRMTPGEKYVEDVSKGKLAEQYITNKGLLDVAELKPVSPINVGGRGVYIPGYGFRSAPWGDKITTKSPGAPHPRTTGGYTLISDPTTGLTLATGPTGQSEPYNPKVHGEQELPGVITDDDAKMYANMMANREMIPSQLRLVVQPFGQAGGLSKNKIFKALKQIDPKYNLKVAEAEYAADTKALTSLSTIYATAQTAMGAAENHGKQILGLSQKVDRTGSPAINRYWVAGKKQIAGDEDVNNLDIALHAFDREFSRYLTSMTAGGVIPQREAEAMRALINSANTPEMLIGAVQTVQKLMEGKKESFSDQFNRIKASLGGQTTPSPKGKSMKLSDGTEITVED